MSCPHRKGGHVRTGAGIDIPWPILDAAFPGAAPAIGRRRNQDYVLREYMLPWFILGVGFLIALLLSARWMAETETRQFVKALRWASVALVSGFFLFLLATGRLNWIAAAAGAVAPFLLRAYRLWSIARNVRRAAGWDRGTKRGNDWSTPGGGEQTSRIKTRFLDMSLDHGTGMIAGVVSTGPRAGRKLDDLTLGELLDLHAYYDREDDESRQVFEGYLDQTHPAWRAKTRRKERRSGRETMTRDEALKILGLDEGAGKMEIKKAYHRLMSGVHPDHGGSGYLAAKLNEARDLLLRGL